MSGDANNFLLDSGTDFLQIVVDRKDVEDGNVEPTLKALRHLLLDAMTVRKFCGRVDLFFHGYNDDPKELHQVPEVRNFMVRLDEKFPFWFVFINLRQDTLIVIHLCLCQYAVREDKRFDIDPESWGHLMERHFGAMNWLIEKYSLGEDLIEQRSKEIFDFFERKRNPPIIH